MGMAGKRWICKEGSPQRGWKQEVMASAAWMGTRQLFCIWNMDEGECMAAPYGWLETVHGKAERREEEAVIE